jgi:fatty acid desaturase
MTTAEKTEHEIENPLKRLTPEQIEEIGAAFQELHDEVKADLGANDAAYIRGIIGLQRRLALLGRALLFGSRNRPAWIAGTATLGMAKILENMEIGHNVLHGQWDWMNDPVINSVAWDWDTASTAEAWRHSHNYIHHTYTNIRGKDKDLGYEIMRIDPHQAWHPVYLLQPLYNALLMLAFEWGVAFHDLDLDAVRSGEKGQKEVLKDLKGIAGKARTQIVKDYVAWPLLSGLIGVGVDTAIAASGRNSKKSRRQKLKAKLSRDPKQNIIQELIARKSFREPFKATVKANFTANIVRNLWSHAIIFCGHFPDQTYTFSQKETAEETQGQKYIRQLIGAANIEGGPMFHIISGNLGYQVEHHLFPDMPSTRYGEIAPRVREICKEYELPYNTGPFFKQWGMVNRTIVRLAFPGGKPRPKPGPYKGEVVRTRGERALQDAKVRRRETAAAAAGGNGSGPS